MPGLIEFLLFFVGTCVVGRGCYLWGHHVARMHYLSLWQRWFTRDVLKEVLADDFDQKVDIVCTACGLVAVVECESCK